MSSLLKELYGIEKIIQKNIYSILLGAAVFFAGYYSYFHFFPVVIMHGEVVEQTEKYISLHIYGKKYRTCKFIEVAGYTSRNGIMRDASLTRVDFASEGRTKPLGEIDIGVWMISPLKDADNVQVYVTHSCGDDDIRVTKIADVPVKRLTL